MIEGLAGLRFRSTPLKYFGGGREPEGSDALRFSAPVAVAAALSADAITSRRWALPAVPSSYLAVALTESGSDELAPYLGRRAVVRGRYLGATERGLSLAVES